MKNNLARHSFVSWKNKGGGLHMSRNNAPGTDPDGYQDPLVQGQWEAWQEAHPSNSVVSRLASLSAKLLSPAMLRTLHALEDRSGTYIAHPDLVTGIEDAQEQLRLEAIGLSEVVRSFGTGMDRNEWRDAVTDQCVIVHLDWDECDARGTLAKLLCLSNQIALDPLVSREAAQLIARGRDQHPDDVSHLLRDQP